MIPHVHDFAQKLQQPSLWPTVVDYVQWQRTQRRAQANGAALPAMPDLAPLSINLDLTTACNFACDHCIDWDVLNSKVRHADQELRESLARMAERGLRSVILIGGGEPTLYPGFVDMVAFLKELRLAVAIVSNGSRGDRLLQSAPLLGTGDWVRLSLDAGSNDTWRRMHKPSSPTLTLEEICGWVSKITAAHPKLRVGYSFVITWNGGTRGSVLVVENLHEMAAAAARAQAAGFHYISFKPFLERQASGAEVMDPAKTAAELSEVTARIEAGLAEARAQARAGFEVVASTNLRALTDGTWRNLARQPRTCHMQMLRQVVSPLGTFNCPAHRGVDKASLGGKALWATPKQAQAQTARMLAEFDASVECEQVTCLYHSTNWWLEELIDGVAPLPTQAPAVERGDAFL